MPRVSRAPFQAGHLDRPALRVLAHPLSNVIIMKALALSSLFSVVCLLLASCGHTVGLNSGNTSDYASTKIKSTNHALIRATTLQVFQEAGFTPSLSPGDTLYFSKQGTRSAQIAWGSNLNDNPVYIRPEVAMQKYPAETRLVCNVFITQASTVYGENVRQPHLAGKSGYERLMRDIRKRVEAAEKGS